MIYDKNKNKAKTKFKTIKSMPSEIEIGIERKKQKMKEEKQMNPKIRSYTQNALSQLKLTGYKELFYTVLYITVSYFFGKAELIMETYPLGIALLCACRRYVPFSFSGLILAAVFSSQNTAIYIVSSSISLLFRYGLYYIENGKKSFSFFTLTDSLPARFSACCAGTLTASLIRIIYGGFLYYDLIASLFYISASLFMVWIYSLYLDPENRFSQKYEAGMAGIFFSVILSLRTIIFLGISVPITVAFFLTYFTARRYGALRGAVVGFLCGAALDLSVCPMFGITGFICGLLSSVSPYIAICVSAAVGIVCGIWTGGIEILSVYLPEASISAVLFMPFEYLKLFPALNPPFLRSVKDSVSSDEIQKEVLKEKFDSGKNTLNGICENLLSLSQMFSILAEKQRRPAVHEIEDICVDIFSENCKGCNSKTLCFQKKKVTHCPQIRQMAEKIYEKGMLCGSDIPKDICVNCYFKDKIITKINLQLSDVRTQRIKNSKIDVMASDYAQTANLLSSSVSICTDEYEINEEETQLLKKKLEYSLFSAADLSVYGKRRKRIIISAGDLEKTKNEQTEIKQSFEKILSCKLDGPLYSALGSRTVMRFYEKARFSADCICGERIREGEEVNGDTCCSFVSDDCFYALICDGMGSGRQASLTSKTSSVFLQKLLCAGCDPEAVMKCLNSFVASKNGECFTTVDLLKIDLLTGKASFFKSGACSSLVLRKDKIFKLSSHTPPIGIMKELCSERIDFEFESGDIALIMSDGICDWDKEPIWLYDLIHDNFGSDIKTLCDKIMSQAQKQTTDDKTVCLIQIL